MSLSALVVSPRGRPLHFALAFVGGAFAVGLGWSRGAYSEGKQSSGVSEGAAAETNKHSTAKWRVYTDRARDLHQQVSKR